jgi:hypothetical protein
MQRVHSFLFDSLIKGCCISDLIHAKQNRAAIIKSSKIDGESSINPVVQFRTKQVFRKRLRSLFGNFF